MVGKLHLHNDSAMLQHLVRAMTVETKNETIEMFHVEMRSSML